MLEGLLWFSKILAGKNGTQKHWMIYNYSYTLYNQGLGMSDWTDSMQTKPWKQGFSDLIDFQKTDVLRLQESLSSLLI